MQGFPESEEAGLVDSKQASTKQADDNIRNTIRRYSTGGFSHFSLGGCSESLTNAPMEYPRTRGYEEGILIRRGQSSHR